MNFFENTPLLSRRISLVQAHFSLPQLFGCLQEKVIPMELRADLLIQTQSSELFDDIKKAGTVNIDVFSDKAPLVMLRKRQLRWL